MATDGGEGLLERPLVSGAPRAERAATRFVWGLLLAAPLAVLAVAAVLVPDPAGHGTHTQLGLPPCGFLLFTGVPCPGCGLTTAFAAMIRLDVAAALHANPAGALMFLVAVASLPVSSVGLARALPIVDTLERLHVDRVLLVLAVASLATWATRVAAALLSLG